MNWIFNCLFLTLLVSCYAIGLKRLKKAPAKARWFCNLLYVASFALWAISAYGVPVTMPTQWFADHIAPKIYDPILSNRS
jgi:hypothetical protein